MLWHTLTRGLVFAGPSPLFWAEFHLPWFFGCGVQTLLLIDDEHSYSFGYYGVYSEPRFCWQNFTWPGFFYVPHKPQHYQVTSIGKGYGMLRYRLLQLCQGYGSDLWPCYSVTNYCACHCFCGAVVSCLHCSEPWCLNPLWGLYRYLILVARIYFDKFTSDIFMFHRCGFDARI